MATGRVSIACLACAAMIKMGTLVYKEAIMSKPTQAGKNGRNSKLEETQNSKNAGNKQSAEPGSKAGQPGKSPQSQAGKKSK